MPKPKPITEEKLYRLRQVWCRSLLLEVQDTASDITKRLADLCSPREMTALRDELSFLQDSLDHLRAIATGEVERERFVVTK